MFCDCLLPWLKPASYLNRQLIELAFSTLYNQVLKAFLFIVTLIVGVCNCCMFCCMLLYVLSSIAIILMGKRELVALLGLSSWCLVIVERPRGCLRFVIVVFPDHTHYF